MSIGRRKVVEAEIDIYGKEKTTTKIAIRHLYNHEKHCEKQQEQKYIQPDWLVCERRSLTGDCMELIVIDKIDCLWSSSSSSCSDYFLHHHHYRRFLFVHERMDSMTNENSSGFEFFLIWMSQSRWTHDLNLSCLSLS